ncbi:MAG TPA: nucleotidyltransferase family protein [Bacillales bacterium]|nr:nucleotidyltransferase family protein [Bacillales bacterium]
MVTAIILAAGKSSRMGTTKQLMKLGGEPLLQHVIEKVLTVDFSEIIAVIGHEAEQIRQSVPVEDNRFRWLINPDYATGQSTSLRHGIANCNNSGIMVFLGDEPLISEQTIQMIYRSGLAKQSASSEPFVVRPSHHSVSGHPVFFGNATKMDFTDLAGDSGAKKMIKNLAAKELIPVSDPGILLDVDTSEDYEKVKQIWQHL